MQQNRTIITIVTVWLLMLMPMMGWSQETGGKSQAFELRQENDSLYWLGVKGGSKSDEWRLAHPVYQFQMGDIDGDGSEDAMVGVIKKTRYYPIGRRLFIFKQIDGSARKLVRPMWLGSKLGGILEDLCGWDRSWAASLRTSDSWHQPRAIVWVGYAHWNRLPTRFMWCQTINGADSA